MSKSGKAYTLTLLVLLALALVNGCTTRNVLPSPSLEDDVTKPVPGPITDEGEQGLRIVSPIKTSYLTVNPVDILYEEKGDRSRDRTFTIAGLRDKDIENKINDRLNTLYQELKARDLPPYRGIRVVIPHASKIVENNLQSYVTFNYNNVISAFITNHRAYMVDGQHYPEYVVVTETVNFDLATGREFTLEKVFTDDVDYRAILSDHVKAVAATDAAPEDFWGVGPALKMVTPFKGIATNPKFHLFQGGLTLIFDYENPEFETNFHPVSLRVSFGDLSDIVAIPARFGTDKAESLYESTAPEVKEFVQSQSFVIPLMEEHVFGNVTVHSSRNYPKNLSEDVQATIDKLVPNLMLVVDDLKRQSSAIQWFLNLHIRAQQVGPYVTLYVSQHSYNQESYHYGDEARYCIDEDGTVLTIRDLFVTAYKYEPVVRERLWQALRDHGLQGPIDPELIDELYEDLQFGLGASEVYFQTSPVRFYEDSVYPLHFSISFKNFGCENMTIFR